MFASAKIPSPLVINVGAAQVPNYSSWMRREIPSGLTGGVMTASEPITVLQVLNRFGDCLRNRWRQTFKIDYL